MGRSKRIEDLTRGLLDGTTLRAKSLIVTVYGDAILPHGGSVWLGSLINLVEPFGLGERMVRTAVFRLTKDTWLEATQIGRRSYYAATDSARLRFGAAHRRIYAAPHQPWDREWVLVHTNCGGLEPDVREALRRDLTWQGFGTLAPHVLAHPAADEDALEMALREHDALDKVVVLRAAAHRLTGPGGFKALVRACWDLDQLKTDYDAFLDRFRPLLRALDAEGQPDPQDAFVLRTLLIHDYRRILLRDPMLPDEVLPPHWPGTAARLLCRNLYRVVQDPAERHLMATLETADGPLPAALPYFRDRFGGLIDEVPAVAE
ncbi:phenylacetic acid degradation operon negative regulatory protein PaaX [Caenispirillum bisanense]|uniref:Transcriptional regulator, PaaX family n=1 Tax=Caenispirillum bisanense TaxID=414052 RepID=A0A286G2P7_9PROT|nr:phenylacetic acid degradation operon negative regulatory protein PaaX [Caenispirillum bisanense]SOD89516.1 transcriptional regulator, PaaX family [Caenispirillum bisanense]